MHHSDPRHTTNDNAAAYFERLTSAGHGSVLEHASFNFLLYGISRSVTHELVRHQRWRPRAPDFATLC